MASMGGILRFVLCTHLVLIVSSAPRSYSFPEASPLASSSHYGEKSRDGLPNEMTIRNILSSMYQRGQDMPFMKARSSLSSYSSYGGENAGHYGPQVGIEEQETEEEDQDEDEISEEASEEDSDEDGDSSSEEDDDDYSDEDDDEEESEESGESSEEDDDDDVESDEEEENEAEDENDDGDKTSEKSQYEIDEQTNEDALITAAHSHFGIIANNRFGKSDKIIDDKGKENQSSDTQKDEGASNSSSDKQKTRNEQFFLSKGTEEKQKANIGHDFFSIKSHTPSSAPTKSKIISLSKSEEEAIVSTTTPRTTKDTNRRQYSHTFFVSSSAVDVMRKTETDTQAIRSRVRAPVSSRTQEKSDAYGHFLNAGRNLNSQTTITTNKNKNVNVQLEQKQKTPPIKTISPELPRQSNFAVRNEKGSHSNVDRKKSVANHFTAASHMFKVDLNPILRNALNKLKLDENNTKRIFGIEKVKEKTASGKKENELIPETTDNSEIEEKDNETGNNTGGEETEEDSEEIVDETDEDDDETSDSESSEEDGSATFIILEGNSKYQRSKTIYNPFRATGVKNDGEDESAEDELILFLPVISKDHNTGKPTISSVRTLSSQFTQDGSPLNLEYKSLNNQIEGYVASLADTEVEYFVNELSKMIGQDSETILETHTNEQVNNLSSPIDVSAKIVDQVRGSTRGHFDIQIHRYSTKSPILVKDINNTYELNVSPTKNNETPESENPVTKPVIVLQSERTLKPKNDKPILQHFILKPSPVDQLPDSHSHEVITTNGSAIGQYQNSKDELSESYVKPFNSNVKSSNEYNESPSHDYPIDMILSKDIMESVTAETNLRQPNVAETQVLGTDNLSSEKNNEYFEIETNISIPPPLLTSSTEEQSGEALMNGDSHSFSIDTVTYYGSKPTAVKSSATESTSSAPTVSETTTEFPKTTRLTTVGSTTIFLIETKTPIQRTTESSDGVSNKIVVTEAPQITVSSTSEVSLAERLSKMHQGNSYAHEPSTTQEYESKTVKSSEEEEEEQSSQESSKPVYSFTHLERKLNEGQQSYQRVSTIYRPNRFQTRKYTSPTQGLKPKLVGNVNTQSYASFKSLDKTNPQLENKNEETEQNNSSGKKLLAVNETQDTRSKSVRGKVLEKLFKNYNSSEKPNRNQLIARLRALRQQRKQLENSQNKPEIYNVQAKNNVTDSKIVLGVLEQTDSDEIDIIEQATVKPEVEAQISNVMPPGVEYLRKQLLSRSKNLAEQLERESHEASTEKEYEVKTTYAVPRGRNLASRMSRFRQRRLKNNETNASQLGENVSIRSNDKLEVSTTPDNQQGISIPNAYQERIRNAKNSGYRYSKPRITFTHGSSRKQDESIETLPKLKTEPENNTTESHFVKKAEVSQLSEDANIHNINKLEVNISPDNQQGSKSIPISYQERIRNSGYRYSKPRTTFTHGLSRKHDESNEERHVQETKLEKKTTVGQLANSEIKPDEISSEEDKDSKSYIVEFSRYLDRSDREARTRSYLARTALRNLLRTNPSVFLEEVSPKYRPTAEKLVFRRHADKSAGETEKNKYPKLIIKDNKPYMQLETGELIYIGRPLSVLYHQIQKV